MAAQEHVSDATTGVAKFLYSVGFLPQVRTRVSRANKAAIAASPRSTAQERETA